MSQRHETRCIGTHGQGLSGTMKTFELRCILHVQHTFKIVHPFNAFMNQKRLQVIPMDGREPNLAGR